MDWRFDKNISKLKEYLIKYDSCDELEKLDMIGDIDNCFEEVLKQRYVKYYDRELVHRMHMMILKLESLFALVRLDTILLEKIHNLDCREIISDDISKNIVDLAKKRLKLFVIDGLKYQLTIKDGYLARPFDYNNQVLNKYGNGIVKDVLRLIEYMEFCLSEMDIKVDIIDKLYQGFRTEQLAFIYAQLEYFEYVNNSRFEYGGRDRYVSEANERIFESMRKRSDSEKIKFMRIICELGYCNIAMGICAMLVELYKTFDNEKICIMLRDILSVRKYGVISYDIEMDVIQYLDSSRRIQQLRDMDIKNGCDVDTIYNYNLKVFNNKKK